MGCCPFLAYGKKLRSTHYRKFPYLKVCRPANFSIITSPWPWLVAGFANYVSQRKETINDNIFHMSDGLRGVYSKMLGVVRILFLVSWVQGQFRLKSVYIEPWFDGNSEISTDLWSNRCYLIKSRHLIRSKLHVQCTMHISEFFSEKTTHKYDWFGIGFYWG